MLSAESMDRPAPSVAERSDSSRWRLLWDDAALAALASAGKRASGVVGADGLADPVCLEAAFRAARRVDSPVAVAMLDEGDAQARLPLRIRKTLGVRQAVPLTSPMNQYAPEFGAPVMASAFRGLLDALRTEAQADILVLRRVREDGTLHRLLVEAGATSGNPLRAPYLDLTAFRDYEDYLASFTPKTRHNRRRLSKKIESEIGTTHFEVLQGSASAAELATATAWKRAWLSQRGLSSPVLDGGNWEQALIEAANAPGARVSVLKAAGTPVAIELGFLCGQNYIAYLGAFNPDYASYRVGSEQMSRTLAWCFSQDVSRYDLLAPEDSYKLHWTRNDTAVTVTDFAVALTPIGSAAALAHHRLRPAARRFVMALPAQWRRRLTGCSPDEN